MNYTKVLDIDRNVLIFIDNFVHDKVRKALGNSLVSILRASTVDTIRLKPNLDQVSWGFHYL